MACELPWLLWITLAVAAAPVCYYFVFVIASTRGGAHHRQPPGPRQLPIVGNLLDLGDSNNLHQGLANLARVHGPVMMLKLGLITTVFVSSRDAAWEAFTKHDRRLAARTVPDTRHALAHSERSMVWLPSSHPLWKTLRGVVASHVFSPRSLLAARGHRTRMVRDMVDCFRRHADAGQEVEIGGVVYGGLFGLLTNVLFSVDATAASIFRELMEEVVMLLAKPNMSDFFPFLRALDLQGLRRFTAMRMGRIFQILDGIIERRLDDAQQQQKHDGKDVLDSLLELVSVGKLTRRDVRTLLFDILTAATETTKTTVEWAMAELLRNPSVMATVRAEIMAKATATTFGGGRNKADAENKQQLQIMDEADVANLPYLQAAVKESMRLHPVAPLLLPHLAVDHGVEIGGYTVPKGATIFFNSWAIMRDPAAWDRADEFLPERFLSKPELNMSGKELKFIPLGSGRRLCPALPMVELVVPFTLASLLQAFEWRLPQGMSAEELDVTERYTSKDILVMAVPLKAVPVAVAHYT
ncbi:hypothetical protein BS78_07G028100 [Paspalum vaginatum]|nr:hypothetical protein BS78_07G028100 [Paspalum vaginatum]